jgi:hypothetical protein
MFGSLSQMPSSTTVAANEDDAGLAQQQPQSSAPSSSSDAEALQGVDPMTGLLVGRRDASVAEEHASNDGARVAARSRSRLPRMTL